MSPTLHPDLLIRARAAQMHGCTVLEYGQNHVVARRLRWHWDCFGRMFTLVRVRRLDTVDPAALREGQDALKALAKQHDPSVLPRGFLHMRTLIDIVLVPEVDAATERHARTVTTMGMGQVGHSVLVLPGGKLIAPRPFFGAAWLPKIDHTNHAIGTLAREPEPPAPLAMAIGWLVFAPAVLTVMLSCCGLPAPLLWWMLKSENAPVDVLPPV